tara:strand:+ start:354 stop:704 length:351 start_codon:yes stop_codon:yes gene_type:complete
VFIRVFRSFAYGDCTHLEVQRSIHFDCNVEQVSGLYRVRKVVTDDKLEFIIEMSDGYGRFLMLAMLFASLAFVVAYVGSGFEVEYLLIALSWFVLSRMYIYANRPRSLRLIVSELS